MNNSEFNERQKLIDRQVNEMTNLLYQAKTNFNSHVLKATKEELIYRKVNDEISKIKTELNNQSTTEFRIIKINTDLDHNKYVDYQAIRIVREIINQLPQSIKSITLCSKSNNDDESVSYFYQLILE